ncbi:hypothetical protein PQQ96_22635 [Paraburkholderia sediminicola]|uniref:hypothetical protein n=1 Tax=Paraburkholderia sediminicola TaxID=458836 RepID=UPI0038B95FE1
MRSFANYMLGAGAILAIALYSANSHAEDADRAQLISQLIQSQQGDKVEPIETQLARMMMLQAKQANPNVGPDKWLAVQGDVNAAVTNMAAEGGGAIATMTRAGVANLSDADLIHLISIYRDPVLVKYMSAVSNPVVQAQVRQASMATGLRVSALIKSVLEKNGLQGIH